MKVRMKYNDLLLVETSLNSPREKGGRVMHDNSIYSSIKNETLVEKRRSQIIQSAITLFKQKGFHRTTTREIAKEAGFSIGTLYEYIRKKEDVLLLVYDAINDHVYKHLEMSTDVQHPSLDYLMEIIDSYYRLMDTMQDEVLILYQEIKSLETNVRKKVLAAEREQVLMLKKAIIASVPYDMSEEEAEILANNIFVHGHMWGFRRWMLHKNYTIDEYIAMQSKLLLQTLQYRSIRS